ncbi:MAG: hypothetical protein QXJ17_04890 [Nitrososphaeria archaeon]
MNNRISFYIWVLLLLLIIPFLIESIYADVPEVVEVKRELQGTDTILNLKIRHSNPSQSHYVDIIEIQINEKLYKINLTPQGETVFVYQANLGQVDQSAQLKVRVNCNLHGWSGWVTLETTTTTKPTIIPIGTKNMTVQIILALAILFGALLAVKKKFKQHHNLLVIATLVNGISILVAMIPSTQSIITQAINNLNTVILLSIIHMMIGIFTTVLAIAVILKKSMKRKKWMRILFTSWMVSFVLGAMVYLIIY